MKTALFATSLMAVSLCAPSAFADDDLDFESAEEPAPRYGPGGTREPENTKSGGGAELGFGIGLTVLGGAGILTGGVLMATCVVPDGSGSCDTVKPGGALMGAGALSLIVGIPLIVIGNRKRKYGWTEGLTVGALPLGGTGIGYATSF